MSVVSRMVERHRDTTFDKERLHADIAASWIVRSLQLCHWSETVRRAHAEPTRSRLARWRRSGGQSAEGAVHDGGRRRRLPSLASLTVGSVGSSFRSQSLHVTCLWRWSSPSQ